jgi:hypothetical protein
MNVFFTGLFPMWHYHFVSELNLIEHHLSLGDSITLLKCDAALNSCEANPQHHLAHCLRCMGIRDHGVHLLSKRIRILPLVVSAYAKKKSPFSSRSLRTVEDLKVLRWKNFDIGWAVYSSLVDRTNTEYPDIRANQSLIQELLNDAWAVFETALLYLEKEKIDRVYIFNGRYAAARPWLRACEAHGITFFTHEKSGSLNRIFLFENTTPHTTVGWPQRIQQFWRQHGKDPEVLREAVDFYEERPKGLLTGWVSFTSHQKMGLLPSNWKSDKKNIVIFSSSTREFAGIEDMNLKTKFTSEFESYSLIAKEVKSREPHTEVYLRIHPNSAKDLYRWWENFDSETMKKLHVIPPESEVSSYHLLWAASVAVTRFSTIGVEATYWGIPSVVIDNSFYSGIDAVYEPQSLEEIIEILCGELPPAKPKENALKYSGFLRCGGFLLAHSSQALNYYTIDFKGQFLEARRQILEWMGVCEQRDRIVGKLSKWNAFCDSLAFRKLRRKLKDKLGKQYDNV